MIKIWLCIADRYLASYPSQTTKYNFIQIECIDCWNVFIHRFSLSNTPAHIHRETSFTYTLYAYFCFLFFVIAVIIHLSSLSAFVSLLNLFHSGVCVCACVSLYILFCLSTAKKRKNNSLMLHTHGDRDLIGCAHTHNSNIQINTRHYNLRVCARLFLTHFSTKSLVTHRREPQ